MARRPVRKRQKKPVIGKPVKPAKNPRIRLVVGKAIDAFEKELKHGRAIEDQIPIADQLVLSGIKTRFTGGGRISAGDLRTIRKIAKKHGITLKF